MHRYFKADLTMKTPIFWDVISHRLI